MSQCVFITGTDTEVGKTLVSRALIVALAKLNYRVSGFKPIAAGCEKTEQGMTNEDAIALQQASNVALTYSEINPFALTLPTSPHIAAKHESISIDFNVLDKSLKQHKLMSDIVVVGIRLGCLNHAMLTVESIENDGLEVVGWVANAVEPCFEFYEDNIQFLEQNISAPKLAEIPHLSEQGMMDADQYINVDVLKLDH